MERPPEAPVITAVINDWYKPPDTISGTKK